MPLALAFASSPVGHPPWTRQIVRNPEPDRADARDLLVVGNVTLHRCTLGVSGYCGRLNVPLDREDPGSGTLSIRLQWLPAHDPEGTVVAEEGGPGYATTGTGDQYQALFSPLGNRNVLLVDQRGTGGSAPIYCADLQPWGGQGGPDSISASSRGVR